MIKITLPDNSVREFDQKLPVLGLRKRSAGRLAKEVLSISVNGEVRDLARKIDSDATINFICGMICRAAKLSGIHQHTLWPRQLNFFYPGTKFGIGPTVENGFYYDIDLPEGKILSDRDLAGIEQKVLELARTKSDIVRSEISKADAIKLFTDRGDQYKLELINDLQDGTITIYKQVILQIFAAAPTCQTPGYKSGKADQYCRCLLAWQREEQNAYAGLRDNFPKTKNARRVSNLARGG